MRAHVIDEAGLIEDTIMVDELAEGQVDASIGGSIGDRVIGKVVVPLVGQPVSTKDFNAPILAELDAIDAKSIRPLREGDTARVGMLEQQAASLRLQLRK